MVPFKPTPPPPPFLLNHDIQKIEQEQEIRFKTHRIISFSFNKTKENAVKLNTTQCNAVMLTYKEKLHMHEIMGLAVSYFKTGHAAERQ